MAIPDVVFSMKPATKIVITQADADRLGLYRDTTAGQVQEAEERLSIPHEVQENTLENLDPYTEL
jgi:hypothetical protein